MDWQLIGIREFARSLAELDKGPSNRTAGNPLLQSDFLVPITEHFSTPRTKILCGRDSGRLKLLIPVELIGGGIWRSFAPSQLPIAPVLHADDLIELPNLAIALREAGAQTILFDLLHHDSDCNLVVAEDSSPIEFNKYCTTMAIDTRKTFDEYWSKRRKKLRDNLKRYKKRALSDGIAVSVCEHRSVSDIRFAFERYAEIESAGWKGKIGTAIAMDNEQGQFYWDVLRRFADRGQARIFELLFDDRVVSSRIGIQCDEMLVFLKTTYDEECSRYSPGRQLLFAALEKLFADQSLSILEFYTNVTVDQAQWATEVRTIQHVTYYSSHTTKLLARVYRSIKDMVRKECDDLGA